MNITENNLDNQIADIDLKIAEMQKLILANDEKEKAIENQIAQEKDEEKRKSLNIKLTEITRDTLCLQQKQIELNAQQLDLTRKKFEGLKNKG